MQPTIFGVPTFGLLAASGAFLSYLLLGRLARREGVDPEVVVDGMIICILGGLVGCRGFHVIQNWDQFRGQPWTEVLRIDKGGLSWYGCFFTIVPAAYVYFRRKRLDAWAMIDLFTITVPLGQLFGRIGCFANGCCFGGRVDSHSAASAIAVQFPAWTPVWASQVAEAIGRTGEILTGPELVQAFPALPPALQHHTYPVLPVQLFMSATGLAVTLFFLWFYGRHRRHGQVFAATFSLLALTRFGFEFIRADEMPVDGLTPSQWISLGAVAFGVGLYWLLGRFGSPYSPPSAEAPPAPAKASEPATA